MSSNNDNDPFIEISRILPLLPYADQLDAYADIAANGLKESLKRLLSSSTYVSHLSQFPDFIHKYIVHFGMRFTKKELIDIIKFGLAIAFCPQVDEVNCNKWKQCVSLLLALSHNYIKKEELQLEWKTFQNAFMRDINEFGICNYTYNITPLDSVLIDKANRYFTSSCVQEIWESERPRIYTSLATESFQGIFDHLQKFTPNQLSHFEEIKQLWLGEIFNMWYQYPTPKFHVAVVKLLAKYSRHFTGRLDMEPHLDRIFNFLITFIYDKNTDRVALASSAELIINSIVPTSNVFKILRKFLKVCASNFLLEKKEAEKVNLPFFCSQLISLFCKRFNFEFTWIPEMKEHIGEVVEWARLTKKQVDEFVEILLPICFEDAFFIEDKCSLCGAIQTLALLRPQNVIPQIIKSLEEASLTPQIPLRLIKSLKFLASCSSLFCRPNVFPIWNHYIGFQPTDQLQNYPLDNTPEQRRQWDSNFSAMIYPEFQMQVPKILNICLKVLNLNQEYYLHDSIRTLSHIFMNMPMKYILGINSSSSLSRVEDLILQIFRRIFKVMGTQNRLYQDIIDNGHVMVQPPEIVHDLSLLAIYIAMSVNSMPKLRVRLFHAFLIIILHTSWNPAVFSKFPDILIWLLSGPRVDGTDLSESDTALHALHKVWPLFLRLYGALKAAKSFGRGDQVDIRLIHLLNILQAFFVIFVPSRVEEVKTNLIVPVLDILFDLCNTSLGYGGNCPPSIDLAKYASECLGVLLYRLLTLSVDFKGVDLFNSVECTINPLWTPFVGYQKAKDLVKWCLPTKRTFSIAKRIIKKFLIPLLRNLAGITNELGAYLEDENLKKIRVPHITIHSQQSGITNQRLYLIALITWIWNICISIFEGLKPRDISPENVKCVGQICSELELLRYENVACPQIGLASRDFIPGLDFFDFPSPQKDSTLRDQIFRCGLQFLDVLAKLSIKFDAQTIGPQGTSMIEKILDPKQLNLLFKIVVYAGFNYVEYTNDEACEFNTHPQIPIRTYCLGFHRDYIEPEDESCGKIGPSSELLALLTRGEKSSLRLGDGGIYGASYLPIVWIMCARRQHFNFIRRAIGLNATWEGTEALSLFTNPRLPANRELNRLVETSLRIALNCNNVYLEEFAVNIHYLTSNEVPGVTTTLTRLFVDFMKSCFESNIFAKSDAEYRVYIFRLKRVIQIIYLLVTKTAYSIELYNNDPALWSQMWGVLLRLCVRSSFTNARLTSGQIQERVNDQNEISQICLHAMNTLETHQFTLYFHASYELEAHSKNSPLRHLIHSAQKLLITLGGCKETIVKFRPPLLVKTAKLRRDAHRYLIQVIDEESMKNDNLDSNSAYLIFKLLSINFQADHWNTHSVYASFPDVELFCKVAPPPPIPSLSTIKKALVLLSSENIELSFAASRFVVDFLLECYLRARERKYVCIDWRSVEILRKCEGLENECQYDCLSSKNYTLRNHILSLINSPNYFQSTSVWMDPYSFAVFPTFSGSHKNALKVDSCNKEWLKFRSEIDLSELTRKEILDWQNGIKIIAEFFATPASWTQMSQLLLNSSRSISKYLIKALKILIQFILLGFGPHPYLQRVEEFIMSLLQPALMQNAKNDIPKLVGPSLVNEILYHVAVGSCSWPRGMKLELYGRVLPRLILYAEATPQRPSISVGFNIDPPIPLSLSNASLTQPTKCDADIADATESNSSSQEDSPANCRLANAIRFGDLENDEIHCFQEEDIPDYCGQRTQICSPISEFLRKFSVESIEFAYLPYIWKCVSKLASVGNLCHISDIGDSECGHGMPGDDGVCPVCVGCRLFPRVDQRRALKEKMMVGLLNVTHWDAIHLLKHFTDMGMEPWEKMVYRNSLSSRQYAMAMSYSFARADFNRIRNTAPPTIRFYKNDGDAPEFYQHLFESSLVTKLIYPLSEFEAPELKSMSLIGPDFIMKRYLPLLVRDVMADLLLKGVQPSVASFALQDDLLSKAPENITPATEKIMKFSQHTRHTLKKGITSRILQMLEFLARSIWSAYPINVLPNTSFDSVFDVLCRLAPLLADYVPIMISGKDNCSIGAQISNLLTTIFQSTIIGHTSTNLAINQADRMLEFLDAFLLHESHQTRDYGLQMMKMIRIHYSTFWKRNDAVDVLRCRLKQGLCNLLKDSSIDVAEAASTELSWALECEMIEYDEEWFSELKEQSRAINQTGTEQEREAMLRNQRAGVLGLCSIIRAHPTHVPDYLPDVIAEVAKHVTDPHPIGQMITTTVNEYYCNVFKFLTSEDRQKFSSKQVEVIESFIVRDFKHT